MGMIRALVNDAHLDRDQFLTIRQLVETVHFMKPLMNSIELVVSALSLQELVRPLLPGLTNAGFMPYSNTCGLGWILLANQIA